MHVQQDITAQGVNFRVINAKEAARAKRQTANAMQVASMVSMAIIAIRRARHVYAVKRQPDTVLYVKLGSSVPPAQGHVMQTASQWAAQFPAISTMAIAILESANLATGIPIVLARVGLHADWTRQA